MTSPAMRWTKEIEARFWRSVVKGDECWLWTGALNFGGYGRFFVSSEGQRETVAHRFAWFCAGRQIPDGLVLDHICRNRRCVRVDHLRCVTMRENVLCGVGITANNSKKQTCHLGHELTPCRGGRHCRTCHRKRNREWARSNRPSRATPGDDAEVKEMRADEAMGQEGV